MSLSQSYKTAQMTWKIMLDRLKNFIHKHMVVVDDMYML